MLMTCLIIASYVRSRRKSRFFLHPKERQMSQAYDLLQSAVEAGKPIKKLPAASIVRPDIVMPQVITQDLVSRARVTQGNKFDPRILYQFAIRNGDLQAVNSLIGGLSNNMMLLRSLIIKVAIEEVGLGNVGLVELVLKTASLQQSTFDQLIILSHAMTMSNKSDFAKALWNVYGHPENYDFAESYGLVIGESCNSALSCLKESDPNVVYWLVKDRMMSVQETTDTIFEEYETIDQELVEIVEGLYRREGNVLYLSYLLALAITRIESIEKPTLYEPTKDQLIKIDSIRTRVVTRQPVIEVTVTENYRSDLPMSALGELILDVSNKLDKLK